MSKKFTRIKKQLTPSELDRHAAVCAKVEKEYPPLDRITHGSTIMKVVISVTAGQKLPHPLHQYSSLDGSVGLEVTTEVKDSTEIPNLVKKYQKQADDCVEKYLYWKERSLRAGE